MLQIFINNERPPCDSCHQCPQGRVTHFPSSSRPGWPYHVRQQVTSTHPVTIPCVAVRAPHVCHVQQYVAPRHLLPLHSVWRLPVYIVPGMATPTGTKTCLRVSPMMTASSPKRIGSLIRTCFHDLVHVKPTKEYRRVRTFSYISTFTKNRDPSSA